MKNPFAHIVLLSLVFTLVSLQAGAVILRQCIGSTYYSECWTTGDCPIPPAITINDPGSGMVYNAVNVPLGVHVSAQVQQIKIDVNGKNTYSEILCSNCQDFNGMTRALVDGNYRVCYKAITYPLGPCQGDDSSFLVSQCISFTVSSKNLPVIEAYSPQNGGTVQGNDFPFTITYSESNLANASIIWRNTKNQQYYLAYSSSCPSGSHQTCTFYPDLSQFVSGDQIEFRFKLLNSEGGMAFSPMATATVLKDMGAINIISPEEGKIYSATKLPVRIFSPTTLKTIKRSIDGQTFTVVCNSCSDVTFNYTFTQGAHNLKVQGIDQSNNIIDDQVNFVVDSIKPYISSTLPINNVWATRFMNFTVSYTETNLKSVKLFLKKTTESQYQEIPLSGCPSGSYKKCTITMDMTGYEPSANYIFEVADGATAVNSSPLLVRVDATTPVLEIVSPLNNTNQSGTKVFLNVNTNGEKVKAIMRAVDSTSFSSMCTNCDHYNTSVGLSSKNHFIKVRAIDYAGNYDEKTVYFNLDSYPPKITAVLPLNGTYVQNNFTVKYTETNVQYVKLFWKDSEASEFIEETLPGCPSSGTGVCAAFPYLPDKATLQYYFEVADYATSVRSKTFTVLVDKIPPALTINAPVDGSTYLASSQPVNIQLDKKVKYLKRAIDSNYFSTLCSNCDRYAGTYYFSKKQHNMTVQAIDYAGNSVKSTIYFTVQ